VTIAGLRDALIRDFDVARQDAARIVASVLQIPSERLVSGSEDAVNEEQHAACRESARRLAAGEPLAYVLGSAGFYKREFFVDERVLVPRPETEHLVDEAIAFLARREHPHALDVGAGSGAIACTIAMEVPRAHVDAVDISPGALEVAAINRDRLHLRTRVAFYLGDLLEPVAGKRYDAIVANLPYVPDGQGEAELRFEPAIALFGGADGLDAYRRFFASVPPFVMPGGIVLAEGAPPVAPGMLALAQAAFPRARVSLERDYGGRDRFVKVETPG
jgi:release factor glutamine methyltransferase